MCNSKIAILPDCFLFAVSYFCQKKTNKLNYDTSIAQNKVIIMLYIVKLPSTFTFT
jgi:hypothetical protein